MMVQRTITTTMLMIDDHVEYDDEADDDDDDAENDDDDSHGFVATFALDFCQGVIHTVRTSTPGRPQPLIIDHTRSAW